MNKNWLFLFLIFLSCSEVKEIGDKTIIPVADVVGTGEILNLSDYAKSVEYIPLETNDSVLVGNIEELIFENNHITLYDFQVGLGMIFREDGHYKTCLGQIGQGPGEYSFLRTISFIPESGNVMLSANEGNYIYDLNGVMKKSMPPIKVPAPYMSPSTVAITDDIYFSHLAAAKDIRYRALGWGQKDTSRIYNLYPSNIKWDHPEEITSFTVSTSKWRFRDQIRCYWSETDTIFTVDSTLEMKKAFVLDWGIYKIPLKDVLIPLSYKESEISKTIGVSYRISESSRYLFFRFFLKSLAPEAFSYKKRNPRGYMQIEKVDYVYGLFDKETGNLTFLNQPVKHKYLGFKNDLDGGPCFWPKYVSSDDKMISWWLAEDFLEIYEQLENPSPALKEMAEKLTPEDNPVLMVVTLK